MTTAIGKTQCITCGKDQVADKCEGCSQSFCHDHLADHRRAIGEQLDEVEQKRNIFRQALTEQRTNPQKHSLIEQINKWEQDSINKIQQTADEARQLLVKHTTKNTGKIEIKLDELANQLKQTWKKNDFNELHLNQFKQKLKELEEEFEKPSNISIWQESSPFINIISVAISSGDILKSTEPAVDLKNTNSATTDSTDHDEFEPGQTRHIQRVNPILIPTNNDKFAATICCHNNQLIYNDCDRTTQTSRLTFLRDIANPTMKQTIDWNPPDTTINDKDDEWIQDIVYSAKLSSYLLLNRTRLRVFKEETNELNEYHTFNDRIMKRLSCSDKYIYLISTHGSAPYNGDEIILMNYNKEEQLCKTFRDIIPNRRNRGAGSWVGEISDLTVGSNEQVIIGYRLERRHEVGVCLFNVTNDGKEWSCVKQLLLNECWHNNLSYTPRIDWSQKLNVFILIEFMTGHLIMIGQEGQLEGECRFMEGENRRNGPINLTVSTNDWLCVRYESSISIHKLTS